MARSPKSCNDTTLDRAAAIAELSRRLRKPLLRFFEKRIGRHPEREDLVQDVFARLARMSELSSIESSDAYLFKIAANLLRDRQRRLTARASDEHEIYDEETHGAARETISPERALLGVQAIEQLMTALYELPERTRAVFALYHFDDLSHAEIARRLAISVSAVEKHMSRANSHLFVRLGPPR
jgi:RNA polymerase sigma factor (sigma-70 family)